MSGSREKPEVEFSRVHLETRAEFPDFRIVLKRNFLFMRAIDIVLRVITFGFMSRFMTNYTTTVGNTVYVSDNWETTDAYLKAATIRHERVHMRQRRHMGPVLYAIYYLFWPLPVIFAVGRRNLEREAYAETLQAYLDYYGDWALINKSIRSRIIGEFLGASYFWMWPFRKSVERWYDDTIAGLVADYPGKDLQ